MRREIFTGPPGLGGHGSLGLTLVSGNAILPLSLFAAKLRFYKSRIFTNLPGV
jgi:hypothetical protein